MTFRGQANANWHLVPTAFRPNTLLGYVNDEFSHTVVAEQISEWKQAQAEFSALAEFVALADKIGLDVPGSHPAIRVWNPRQNQIGHSIGSGVWPPESFFEVLALAQHHGVPTRLLDMTYDPLVAAYFAAECPDATATDIAVWSINTPCLARACVDLDTSLKFVIVPRARNAYLSAQRGLFVLDTTYAASKYRGLEFAINARVLRGVIHKRIAADVQIVVKYTLPSSMREELLHLLARRNVDRAHLMPSFRNVVEELERRRTQRRLSCRAPTISTDSIPTPAA